MADPILVVHFLEPVEWPAELGRHDFGMFGDVAILAGVRVLGFEDEDVTSIHAPPANLTDRTNVELARLVGLSPAATLHRVRRLKESGVIRVIAARLDPAAAGFPLHVYVAASLARHDPRSSRVFEDQVRAIPQITGADNVAGEMDYLLTIVARDVAELQQVLARLATRGGQRLVTYLRLEEVKPPSPLPLVPTPSAASRARRTRSPT